MIGSESRPSTAASQRSRPNSRHRLSHAAPPGGFVVFISDSILIVYLITTLIIDIDLSPAENDIENSDLRHQPPVDKLLFLQKRVNTKLTTSSVLISSEAGNLHWWSFYGKQSHCGKFV